jgi:trimethylamine--corrinoid protein Co-methyltransferase
MIVLSDELVAMTDALINGIEVTDETLMLDELHEVGPGGHFLNTDATMARFRDFWYPDLMSREIRETWLERGASTLSRRLNEKVKTILKEHRPTQLEPKKRERVQEILAQVT